MVTQLRASRNSSDANTVTVGVSSADHGTIFDEQDLELETVTPVRQNLLSVYEDDTPRLLNDVGLILRNGG